VTNPAGSWLDALRAYARPRPLAMLFLGFSAGLPFFLVFQTLSAWLREAGIERSTIGLLSYVGLVYALKFLWAPVVDRAPLPVLTRVLGRRRSWMLLAQLGLVAGLYGMAQCDPTVSLTPMIWLALLTAFSSATQDITIDAWRIEAAPQSDQGIMAATYQLGYRAAITAATAGALWLGGEYGFSVSYTAMALLVGVGLATTLIISEPQATITRGTRVLEQRVVDWLEEKAHWPRPLRAAGGHFIGAVVCPFADFFARNGARRAALILAFIGCFRLTDYTMGVMSNPFYLDVGYSLQDIAVIAKIYGIAASIIGVIVGGLGVARLGTVRALVVGGVLVILTNLAFATLAFSDQPSLFGLGLVVSADNFAYQFAGTAFIAYMSGLTNAAYTATQYALFSSIFALPGKLLMGLSGFVVDAVGYPWFFLYTSLLGLPALLLIVYLERTTPRLPPPTAGA
jgi:MFS transporter, PAT family, beta-lactamase induction signal transducer AmpG